mgnify:CR=1 FL=1
MRTRRVLWVGGLLTLLSLAAWAGPDQPEKAVDPEAPWAAGAMAAAANPHAVEAAMTMLRRGGHAVDAAIAAHAVLGLVEPQSSGIGGGAFMLVYERNTGELIFHDGRETAPAGATPDMFMHDGEVMKFLRAWQGGVAIGVPGAVKLYEDAHRRHGKLPWQDLFAPAIALAEQGFEVSPRLAGFLPRMRRPSRLDENPGSAEYFYPDGKPLQAGTRLKNPEYAATLGRIAREGSVAFYTGEIAAAIAAVAQRPPDPGSLSVKDIAAYRTVQREAVCHQVAPLTLCGPTPPSSAAAVMMMYDLYARLAREKGARADEIAAFVDAQRLAYADRDHFFGDPDAADVPVGSLLSSDYLERRAMQRFEPGQVPVHGDPFRAEAALQWAEDKTREVAGTSHLSIVDAEGNAVSMTATVEAPFGSARWVAGFLLNNQMTDFARDYDGGSQANMVRPGMRPRSSMSPMMVFDDRGMLKMVTGSPGGNSIPAYVLKSLVGTFRWGLDLQDAVEFPNIIARGETVRVEVSVEPGQALADDLKARGYKVQERQGENSGLHVILLEDGVLQGAADSRREGTIGYLAPD